jgi:hypothetical protein
VLAIPLPVQILTILAEAKRSTSSSHFFFTSFYLSILSRTPVAAIAGGVVGGVAAIAILALLFFFFRRRRPRSTNPYTLDLTADDHPNSAVTPFMSSHHPTSSLPNVNAGPGPDMSSYTPSGSTSIPGAVLATGADTPPRGAFYTVPESAVGSSTGVAPASEVGLSHPQPHTHYAPSTITDTSTTRAHGGLSPVFSELPPYTDADAAMSTLAFGGGLAARANTSGSASGSGASADFGPFDGDALTQWANEHRDVITYELEEKLRRAGYQPRLDPDRISGDEWLRMGVGAFSVGILRDLWKQRQ